MRRFVIDENSQKPNSDISTTFDNLNRLDKKQEILFKSRDALIKELSYSLCQSVNNSEDMDNSLLFSSIYKLPKSKFDKSVKHDRIIEKYFDSISQSEKFSLYEEISNGIDDKKSYLESILGKNEKCDAQVCDIIAYVKNNYTDEAFLKFSKIIEAPKCLNLASFEAVCENVYDGKSEYCIVPVESSSDGRLLSFYSMIDRYELKIVNTCIIEHQDGQKYIKFALLRKSIKSPDTLISSMVSMKSSIFEMRFTQSLSEGESIYKILEFADVCSMKLLRIDSILLPYSNNLVSFCPVFSIYKSEFLTFLTFLAFEFPQCYTVGLYSPVK